MRRKIRRIYCPPTYLYRKLHFNFQIAKIRSPFQLHFPPPEKFIRPNTMSFTDRRWMYCYGRRRNESAEFVAGLRMFMQFALSNPAVAVSERIACPCRKCKNSRWESEEVVARHIMNRGFVDGYYTWWAHGEVTPPTFTGASTSARVPDVPYESGSSSPPPCMHQYNAVETDWSFPTDSAIPAEEYPDVNLTTPPSDTTVQQGEAPNEAAARYLNMLHSHDIPIMDGSDKTVLQLVSELLAGKVQHGLSQDAFNYFLQMIRGTMRPEDAARIPKDYYDTKKFFQGLRLDAVVMDVCVNDCIIYDGRYHSHQRCPYCKESRYATHNDDGETVTSKTARKRLWYFPIIPRLQRLFYCPKVARQMTWHANCNNHDNDELIHPACGEAWKHFNRTHPDFALEDRNPRLGFCTDGMNPYSSRSTYSIWPVYLTVYNLPPEMCMKQEFIFLSMIIQGPKGPGKNIDVMLRPLIDDLQTLWHEGVETYDVHRRQNFIMRAALMWTVTDYPGYGMVSAWSTHGGLSCPYCMENTEAFWLPNGKKFSFFDCHRQFLPADHPFRNNKTEFTPRMPCHTIAPDRRDGESMYNEVLKLKAVKPGKTRKAKDQPDGFGICHNWNQRSIFWELEYWPTLLVRHNLDVMHIEKNFFDNLFYTLLDDPAKTKDNLNSRHDLELLKFTSRKALYLKQDGNGRYKKPQAIYTVSREEKKRIFEWISNLKFPDGYASNLSTSFNAETLQVVGMKSHDCHVFLQRLLPVAFDALPGPVWEAIAEISLFFRRIGAPRIRASEMEELQVSIAETLCKLEKIFPPSFFDCMEHLPVHLPYEARVCGPVQYRWMYPFERQMLSLKRDTRNKARPEGSICEAYLDLEIVNFCTLYFGDEIDTFVTNRLSRNEVRMNPHMHRGPEIFRRKGQPIGPRRLFRTFTAEEYNDAHLYILQNCDEVDPYITAFDEQFCVDLSYTDTQNMRKTHFRQWFANAISSGQLGEVDLDLQDLARGPGSTVRQYRGYLVNGYRFHTASYGVRKGTTNSGVCVHGTTNEDGDTSDFYGILQDVIEVDFARHSIVLFKCHWFDTTSSRGYWRHPRYGLVEINPNRAYPLQEPFILANQATQVYYAPVPSLRRGKPRRNWWAVFTTRARHVIDGLTDISSETTSDDEQISPDPHETIFQDTALPRLTAVAEQNANDEGPLHLATEEFEELSTPVYVNPTTTPTIDDMFLNDDVEEYYDSD